MSNVFFAPLHLWRMQHGKSLTLVAVALGLLYAEWYFSFEIVIFIALWAYGFEL